MTFKVSYQKADDLKMIPSCLNEEIFCSQVDEICECVRWTF